MACLSRSLNQAVRAGRVALVKSLLQMGANVNAKDCKKQTALHLACAFDFKFEDMESVVELLIQFGAEVNVQDEEGRTPLHEACLNNKQRCVEALLRYGAKISVIDFAGRTPLHDTIIHWKRKHYNSKLLVDALLASYKSEGSMESRPQQLAHNNEDEDILAAVNLQDNHGYTALHLASKLNDKELVCLLLRKGAKVGIKDNQGKTALHFAAEAHSVQVVDVLVDYGAYVNAKDSSGNTPLHLACTPPDFISSYRFDESTVDKLLNRGAKASEKNMRLKTPIENLHEHWSPIYPSYRRCFPLLLTQFEEREIIIAVEKTFMKHVIKMRELKTHVKLDIQWKSKPVVCDEIRNECSKEIEDMKCTKIVKDITLYEVLSHTNQPYLLSSDDLLVIDDYLRSPDIMKRFPLYGDSLKTTFQRSKLLTLAVQSFYSERRKSMVKKLPYEMTEHLMTFLSNEDLRNFLNSE